MSEISTTNQDTAFVELVDKWIDGSLDAAESETLEKRLLRDPEARDFCAQRMRFHSDLQNSLTPMRVEVVQKKHMVLEKSGGLFKFFSRESQVARIGNPSSGKFIELPPLLDHTVFKRRALWAAVVGLLIISLLVFALFQKKQPTTVSIPLAPTLELRNSGFEETDLTANENSSSFGILHWQDHFRSIICSTVDLSRESQQKYQAHSGNNVVRFDKGGYLTQRLELSNGQAFLAKPGLKLRLTGWALLPDSESPQQLFFALRVVKDVQPHMRQYEPCVTEIKLTPRSWKQFSVDLTIPHDSLEFKPAWVDQVKDLDKVADINGDPLTLSIDNRSKALIYLDDLSIEEITKAE